MLMFDIAVVITVLGMNALSALCYSREKKRTGLILKALADGMANLKQQARVDRLKQQGDKLSLKKTKFVDDGQLEFG